MFETADKLLVAPFKRILGVDTVQTRHIDQSEQQVAQLLFHPVAVHPSDFLPEFVRLLLHLFPHILAPAPVETGSGSLLPDTERLHHGR